MTTRNHQKWFFFKLPYWLPIHLCYIWVVFILKTCFIFILNDISGFSIWFLRTEFLLDVCHLTGYPWFYIAYLKNRAYHYYITLTCTHTGCLLEVLGQNFNFYPIPNNFFNCEFSDFIICQMLLNCTPTTCQQKPADHEIALKLLRAHFEWGFLH